MRKMISTILLFGGLLLLYFGYDGYPSLQSEINQFLGGSSSDKAIWMLVGGAAATLGGIVGLLGGKKSL